MSRRKTIDSKIHRLTPFSEYVSTNGTVAAHFEYDPYGNEIGNQQASIANAFAFRFSTKYFDSETGLYYYGYRYHSPELGRWLNRDPMGENGGLNLYAFCVNDPAGKVDLWGLYDTDFLNRSDMGYFPGTLVGGHTVIIHGGKDGSLGDQRGTSFTPQQVLDVMKLDGYVMGSPIVFFACYGGIQGGAGEELARLSGGQVTAATGVTSFSRTFGIDKNGDLGYFVKMTVDGKFVDIKVDPDTGKVTRTRSNQKSYTQKITKEEFDKLKTFYNSIKDDQEKAWNDLQNRFGDEFDYDDYLYGRDRGYYDCSK